MCERGRDTQRKSQNERARALGYGLNACCAAKMEPTATAAPGRAPGRARAVGRAARAR